MLSLKCGANERFILNKAIIRNFYTILNRSFSFLIELKMMQPDEPPWMRVKMFDQKAFTSQRYTFFLICIPTISNEYWDLWELILNCLNKLLINSTISSSTKLPSQRPAVGIN